MHTEIISRLPRLRHALAAAALLAAGSAFAGVQGDLAWGETMSHGTTLGDKHSPVFQWDLGYRFDNNLAAQVIGFNQFDVFRNLFQDEATARYGFDRFIGVQGLAYLPLNPLFELKGGVGVGRSTLNNGFLNAPDRKDTDALLTAGIQWHAAKHFNVAVDANYLTKTEVSTVMLSAQFSF